MTPELLNRKADRLLSQLPGLLCGGDLGAKPVAAAAITFLTLTRWVHDTKDENDVLGRFL